MTSMRSELLNKELQEEEEAKNELLKTSITETMDKNHKANLLSIVKKSAEENLRKQEKSNSPLTKNSKSLHSSIPTKQRLSLSNKSAAATPNNLALKLPFDSQLNHKEQSLVRDTNKLFKTNFNHASSSIDNEQIHEQVSVNNKSVKNTAKTLEVLQSNFEKWKLNTLHGIENKNTPMLIQPEYIEPDDLICVLKNELNSEPFKKLCKEMSEQLEIVREKYILSKLSNNSGRSQPFKITTKGNDSLEKNQIEENSPGPDVSSRDMHDRASKRKALCNIGAAAYDSNDENSDDEFIDTKKRKFQQAKKAEEEKKNMDSQKYKASFVSPVEMIEVDDTKDLSDSEFDNSNMRNLYKSLNTESNYEQLQYPRRVLPPNPSKKNFKGPRAKKKNIIQSKNSSVKKDSFLNDEEIIKTLNELNEEIDDSDCVDITDEKKNSSVPTRFACSYLENVHVAEKQKFKVDEEARIQKQREETLKKDEFYIMQLQGGENDTMYSMEKERSLNEKKKHTTTKRTMKSNFNKPRQISLEVEENCLQSDDSDDNKPTQICPICQKLFSKSEICDHAAECTEFSSVEDEISFQEPCSSRNSSLNEFHLQ